MPVVAPGCDPTQVYNRARIEYLPEYEPSAAEKADPDLYASNVRAVMAAKGHRVLCNHSNYDGLLVAGAMDRRKSLADYAMRNLISAVETREAMSFSRQHYSNLVSLAQAFKSADSRACGACPQRP